MMIDNKDTATHYEEFVTGGAPVKAWIKDVPIEDQARMQLGNIARLQFIHSHVAAMPDVHVGRGATVGSVIATKGAIVPAAVGVDLGCGMMAVRTSLHADQLPDSLKRIRSDIERTVPHGGIGIKGGWRRGTPKHISQRFMNSGLADGLKLLEDKHKGIIGANSLVHLGTLGTGNHFIEMCLDEENRVWVMLHSGSRGIGNRIGSYFIEKARTSMEKKGIGLPDRDLSWFEEGEQLFDDYVEAVDWAQNFAKHNRIAMMEMVLKSLRHHLPGFKVDKHAVNCHHNYVERENHFGADVWVTRKGAVSANTDELGIIPGSMGAKSFIVRGKGNADSFCSCSHGAGRIMSRTKAKKAITLDDHIEATQGVECRKDLSVLDESPAAYKDIDKVMAAQDDLVDIVHTLKQVVCVKG